MAIALRGQANVWTPALDLGDVSWGLAPGPRAAGVRTQWPQLLAEQMGFTSPGPPQGNPVLLPSPGFTLFEGCCPRWGRGWRSSP